MRKTNTAVALHVVHAPNPHRFNHQHPPTHKHPHSQQRTSPNAIPGLPALTRSRFSLEKYMKPERAFLGALGSFFLRALRAGLPPSASAAAAAFLGFLAWGGRGGSVGRLVGWSVGRQLNGACWKQRARGVTRRFHGSTHLLGRRPVLPLVLVGVVVPPALTPAPAPARLPPPLGGRLAEDRARIDALLRHHLGVGAVVGAV